MRVRVDGCTGVGMTASDSVDYASVNPGNPASVEADVWTVPRGWKQVSWDSRGDAK